MCQVCYTNTIFDSKCIYNEYFSTNAYFCRGEILPITTEQEGNQSMALILQMRTLNWSTPVQVRKWTAWGGHRCYSKFHYILFFIVCLYSVMIVRFLHLFCRYACLNHASLSFIVQYDLENERNVIHSFNASTPTRSLDGSVSSLRLDFNTIDLAILSDWPTFSVGQCDLSSNKNSLSSKLSHPMLLTTILSLVGSCVTAL